jgi:hypothetical protein
MSLLCAPSNFLEVTREADEFGSLAWNGHRDCVRPGLKKTHTGSRPAGKWCAGRVHSGHPPPPDIGRSFGGSDTLRVNTSVRGEVIDLAARDTDIH